MSFLPSVQAAISELRMTVAKLLMDGSKLTGNILCFSVKAQQILLLFLGFLKVQPTDPGSFAGSKKGWR